MTTTRKGYSGALSMRVYYAMACGVGGVYLPFFPRWLESRGMVGLRFGVIAAAAPAMSILAPTAIGAASDALGLRGGLLQLACAGAFLTVGSLAVAAATGLPMGFGLLLVSALAFALFRAPMQFIADVVALELAPAVGTTYGRLRLWGSIGFAAVVPLASRYVDPLDAASFPLVTTGFVLAALLASLRLPRGADLPQRPRPTSAGRLLAQPGFALFLAAVFLGQCGQAAYDLCFSFRLFELGVPRTTFAFALAWDLGTCAEVFMMAFGGALFRRFSPASLLALAFACSAIRWSAVALVRSPGLLLALQPLHALSWGLGWLASLAYTSRRCAPESLGTAQGLFTTAVGAGSVVGMVTWGSIYQRGGGALVFAGAAVFAAVACLLALLLERRVRGLASPPP